LGRVDIQSIRTHKTISSFVLLIAVVLLTAGAVVAVTLLVRRVDSSRRAELAISSLTQTVNDLEAAPFSADPAFNSGPNARSPELTMLVTREIQADEATILAGLFAASRSGGPAAVVGAGRSSLARVRPAAARVYAFATQAGGLAASPPKALASAQAALVRPLRGVLAALSNLKRVDAANANRARTQAEAGTIITMLLLLGVFGYFYLQSDSLSRENEELLGLSREEASTDVLTGLGNRRALMEDLSEASTRLRSGGQELLVSIFDLDGFKQYNDTFGHASGDALLKRLGGHFSEAVSRSGRTYRMGGDEFCMLAWCAPDRAEILLDDALTALSDAGEGWHVSSSHGAIWMPSEAATSTEALLSADMRMYANKASRSSTGRQITDVLLQVLSEQDKSLDTHGAHVAELSGDVAQVLRQSDAEIQRIRLAGALHDIGKTAIPASLLNKPGPLDERDWEFIHRHTLIGARIVLAAPALAGTAPLIRSSHENMDGSGYPDQLEGEQIPLGSRIISACDAFDAMTSERPYRATWTSDAAVAELERCSGSQFDPDVVGALGEIVASKPAAAEVPAANVAVGCPVTSA
jgi:diguanylate cyclase (GGDEF)-like protein